MKNVIDHGLLTLFPELADKSWVASLKVRAPAVYCPTLIIAMTARTGSTNLTQIISQKTNCGIIEEIFNFRDVVPAYVEKGLDFDDYYRLIQGRATGGGLVFKTSWEDFRILVELGLLDVLFPRARYVYLDRCDIEAQAVSLNVAVNRDAWHKPKGDGGQGVDVARFEYVKNPIDQCLVHLMREKIAWLNFFGANRICWATYYYECFSMDFEHAADQIIEYSGFLKSEAPYQGSPLEPTRDVITAQLLRQYKIDRRGLQEGIYDV